MRKLKFIEIASRAQREEEVENPSLSEPNTELFSTVLNPALNELKLRHKRIVFSDTRFLSIVILQ